jgi:hypothetical protein
VLFEYFPNKNFPNKNYTKLGVAVLDPKSSGKIGAYAMCYYMVTTVLAAILG